MRTVSAGAAAARVKNGPGKAEGDKNKLMWLCHKEPSSPYGQAETKNILSLFSVAPHGSVGAVGGLSEARETALLLHGLGRRVLPSAVSPSWGGSVFFGCR